MTQPRATTYQAEILRFIHDQPSSTLRDTEVGVVRRIWNERGQLCGESRGSISSAISDMEMKGCLVTEFGTLPSGRPARIAVAVVEEPPIGETVYHPRRELEGEGHEGPGFDGQMPSAEQVAAELLKLAVAAASVPVTDIQAALHHNECLRSEIDDWVEVATEAEERARTANDELLTLRIELDESQGLADKIDAEWSERYTVLERVHHDRGEVIERLEKKLSDDRPVPAVYGQLKELQARLTEAGAIRTKLEQRVDALKAEVIDLRSANEAWAERWEKFEEEFNMVSAVAQGQVESWYKLLDDRTRSDLSAIIRQGAAAKRASQS